MYTYATDRDKFRTYETEIVNRLARVRQYKDYLAKMKTQVKKEIDSSLSSAKKKVVQKLEQEADSLNKDIDRALRGKCKHTTPIASYYDGLRQVITHLVGLDVDVYIHLSAMVKSHFY